MSNILITGGTGFLGKHLQKALKDHHEVHSIWTPSSTQLNLLNKEESSFLIEKFKPDVILHMAALLGGILANKTYPMDYLHQNLDMASNIFHAALQSGCQTIYTIGSVCSYPKITPTPFKEDDLWNGYPEETNAPYGNAKRMLLMMQQAARKQHNMKGAHFLMVNLYGEYDDFDPETSHVIPALIRKCIHAKSNNLPTVEVWGDGTATREFLYAGDAAQALVMALDQKLDTNEPINLGTGKDISIKDLSYLIREVTGYEGQMVFNGGLNGQPKRLLNIDRAKELLGFQAKTHFMEGLIKTIQWYQD
jgi:GDP-L-fucose synthase